jgi:hypothetical protein
MKSYLIYLIALIAIFCFQQIDAQEMSKSDGYPPPWRGGDMPRIDNRAYYLKEVLGEGKTVDEARQKAKMGLISAIGDSKGITVTGNELSEILSKIIYGTNDPSEEITSTYQKTYNINIHGFETSFEFIDEYWEESQVGDRTVFYCWVLFEVAQDPNTKIFDKVQFSTNYGFASALKSAIVPGWGQFSKMQKIEGLSIFGGEVVLLGLGLGAEYTKVDYTTRMNNTRDVSYKKQYLNLANDWENVRNISLAFAAALYVYNVIDAVVSTGAKKYIYSDKFSLVPQRNQKSFGISLVYNLK